MPIGLEEMPTKREDIKNCQFYMINGQHSIKASKRMRIEEKASKILKKFQKWKYLIIWSKDHSILCKISS